MNKKKEMKSIVKEIEECKKQLKESQRAVGEYQKIINQKEKQLAMLVDTKDSDISMTDHAVIRMLERHYEFMEVIYNIREDTINKLKSHIEVGAKRVTIDGIVYVIEDNTIVTII